MRRWGSFVHRHRWPIVVVSCAAFVLSIVALFNGGQLKNASDYNVDSVNAAKLEQRQLPTTTGWTFLLLFSSDSLSYTDTAYRQAVQSAVSSLGHDTRVSSIETPYNAPASRALTMVSSNGHSVFATVNTNLDFSGARQGFTALRDQVHSSTLSIATAGDVAVASDFDTTLASDLRRSEVISLPLALILLVIVFGTGIAALLCLGVGVFAVAGGIGITSLIAHGYDVSTYAINVVTLIGLGIAIDYSLFIVTRFREELARDGDVERAVGATLATAGRAVAFSGITVALGLGGLLFYTGTPLVSMGVAGAIVVAVSVLYALTFLPALLAVLGMRVNRFRVPLLQPRPHGEGMWHRLAHAVMRRPWTVLLPTVAVLLAAGSPFLGIDLASTDVGQLPSDAQARIGSELLQQQFPAAGQNTIEVVLHFAEGNPGSPSNAAATRTLSAEIASTPGVVSVSPGGTGANIAVIDARTPYLTTSDQAHALVRTIRNEDETPGATVLVTGNTAFDVDFVDYMVGHTPQAFAFVVVTTFIVLLLLLRSLALPLKAVLMNALSLSAAFGALVWVFQQGHLSGLLGFTPGAIDPTIPVLLFCIVFGLSMDYEVFLLTRMQEEWRRTHDNRSAVADGLERSGRLVTGAAAIMACVFLAFALASVVTIKSIGLGMAIAVVADATLVRALVVPATMRLLGGANWWAPKWLRMA
ncbi:MAG: MMPL family transporter [Candidatus Dormibacteria bacterium]